MSARKPVQSFDPADGLTDADRLAEATAEQVTEVCPEHRWYPVAMAPPMAAERLGLPPFTLVRPGLGAAVAVQARCRSGRTGRGARVSLAADGDGADLVELLSPDLVVLVAGAGLGILSDVRLAARALGAQPLIVYLNRFDPTQELHERNRGWLAERDAMVVAVSPRQLARPWRRSSLGRPGPGPS